MTPVLFLGGLRGSGTTLVERLLAELPGVVALGEIAHLWQRGLHDGERCGCGVPFRRCRFWEDVGRLGFGGWWQVDLDRVRQLQRKLERTRQIPRLAAGGWAPELTEYLGYHRRIYSAAASLTGARLVVDSSKHSALAWGLRRLDLDLRVVQVVRDPRAVAYSWTRQLARPESRDVTRYRPAGSALRWTAQHTALELLARSGVPMLRIRYEQLLAEPHRQLRVLARFAGLRPGAGDLSFLEDGHAELRAGHSVAGNPMRYRCGRVPLRYDDAWHARLPARHRRLVGAICAPLLAAYGYPVAGPAAAPPAGAAPVVFR